MRELKSSLHKVSTLGIWVKDQSQGEEIAKLATALESGRYEFIFYVCPLYQITYVYNKQLYTVHMLLV